MAGLVKHTGAVLPGSDNGGVDRDASDVEEEPRDGNEEEDGVPPNTDKAETDTLGGGITTTKKTDNGWRIFRG